MDNPFPSPALDAVLAAANPEDVKPGAVEAVGPDVRPGDPNPLITLGWNEEFIEQMWKDIDAMALKVKNEGEKWKVLLKEYTPTVVASGTPEAVKTPGHFRNVHSKIGQLFLQTPEIRVVDQPVSPLQQNKPSPFMPGLMLTMEDIISVKQEILNKKLGRDGIKANRLMDELLFDVLGVSGLGCSKLGHTIVLKDVQEPVMVPDPTFIPPPPPPGSMLGLNTPTPEPPMVPQTDPMTGEPVMQTIQVPIYEEDYWRRFSPWKALIDAKCTSTRYDEDADMVGMWFTMTPYQASQAFGIPEDELKGENDELKYQHDESEKNHVIMGVELSIKACSVPYSITHPDDPTYKAHPKALYQLVLLKHIKDKPIVWRPNVDQSFTETGELTQDSLDRFPFRFLTIRDFCDSPFPQSDSAFTNSQIKTRNTTRRQEIKLRDAAIGKYLMDAGLFEDNDVEAFKAMEAGDIHQVKEGALSVGVDKLIATTPQVKMSGDTYRLDATLNQEINETLGISANSAGTTNDTVRAATEIAATQQAAASRNKKEQMRVIDFYLDGVRLIDTLIMRYVKRPEIARITGPDGVAKLMMWNGEMLNGRWMYEIAPDSQLVVDTAVDRQQNLAFYNLVAKDPMVNREPILKRLARQFGYDPARIILNPAMMAMQPPHGGAANKHEMEKTGQQEGGVGQQRNAQQDQRQQEGME